MTLRRKAIIITGGTLIGILLLLFTMTPSSRLWTIIGTLLLGSGVLALLDRVVFAKLTPANPQKAGSAPEAAASSEDGPGNEPPEQQTDNLTQTQAKLLEYIIDSLPDPTFAINAGKKVIAWNRAIEKLTGISKEAVMGKGQEVYSVPFHESPGPLLIDLVGGDDADLILPNERVEKKGDILHSEILLPPPSDGKGAFLWAKASPIVSESGQFLGAIESVCDITNRTEAEERLRYLSVHDALTGMYNRSYFSQEMYRLSEEQTAPITIFICDIDGLKLINDTMGHHAGDNLILNAAKAIIKTLPDSAITARIAGDEFAILLPGIRRGEADEIYQRMHHAISQLNESGVFELPIALTIGFATTDEPLSDLSFLFKEADNNMFHEKLYYNHNTQTATIQILMKALEVKDFVKDGHVDRLQSIVASVGAALGMSERRINDLRLLAKFHDIGKVGIPDRILLKRGPLSPAEMNEMQRHCEFGFRIAQSAPVLVPIADGILKHHEWWNGKGYPLGLREKEIPLDCRLLAIADAYDALTSDRPYRKAMSTEKAAAELLKRSGSQFDPELVTVFLDVITKNNGQTKITVLNN